jgi:outer membrane receptor protein involved in Fe transport
MFPKNYAAYGQSAVTLFGPVQIMGGIRYEHWGINDSSAWMPRAEMKIQLDSRLFAFGGVASYSQMPSLPIMLGVTQNISLKPIKDLQTDAGLEFIDIAGDQFGASAYTRTYTNYPVSTEFHSLSLADIVDPFGLPYIYMPMTSAGTGYVSGLKMHMATSSRRRAFLQASLTSQVVTHKALDGVSRPALQMYRGGSV